MKYIDPKEQEQMFQDALSHWKQYKDKVSWDKMFYRVYECCLALAKKKAYGINIPELESKAMDAACYAMDLINRGNYPSKLSAMCYLHVNKFLYSERNKRAEREVQLSVLLENVLESEIEGATYDDIIDAKEDVYKECQD